MQDQDMWFRIVFPERLKRARLYPLAYKLAAPLTRRNYVIEGRSFYYRLDGIIGLHQMFEVHYEFQTFSKHIMDRYHEKDESS